MESSAANGPARSPMLVAGNVGPDRPLAGITSSADRFRATSPPGRPSGPDPKLSAAIFTATNRFSSGAAVSNDVACQPCVAATFGRWAMKGVSVGVTKPSAGLHGEPAFERSQRLVTAHRLASPHGLERCTSLQSSEPFYRASQPVDIDLSATLGRWRAALACPGAFRRLERRAEGRDRGRDGPNRYEHSRTRERHEVGGECFPADRRHARSARSDPQRSIASVGSRRSRGLLPEVAGGGSAGRRRCSADSDGRCMVRRLHPLLTSRSPLQCLV